jgi:two-component sensor histidine kinase
LICVLLHAGRNSCNVEDSGSVGAFEIGDVMKSTSGAGDPDSQRGRAFLDGGGEMGALTRAYDWASTPLGAPDVWPQSLRTTLRLLLNTRHPMFIWWGSELIQFYNDAYRQTMGPERHPRALGQPGRECWDEIWDIIGPQIEFVMAGEGATWHEDQLVPVTRFGKREDVWWTYGFSPIDDENGGVGGVLVVCNDVTKRVVAERHRELLAREMNHRVKNTLATVQAIARQCFRDGVSPAEARAAFESRLIALSRTQDMLLSSHGGGAFLSTVVETAIEHYEQNRFHFEGPSVWLAPAAVTAMAMALHELSTNAAKYGALSVPNGRVEIVWELHSLDEAEQWLRLRWSETGGPPVEPPRRRGFGSRLIERGIATELGGKSHLEYDPMGIVCKIEAPLAGIQR